MTITINGSHPAPTPLQPREYTLFFIPCRLAREVEAFFTSLDEPDEHFLLLPVMRIDQLASQPARIMRGDVRALMNQRDGVWVALTKAAQIAQLRAILSEHASA
jgi:hypothetical protein